MVPKLRLQVRKGTCKHYGQYGHKESSCYKIIWIRRVGDPEEREKAKEEAFEVVESRDAEVEGEAVRQHTQPAKPFLGSLLLDSHWCRILSLRR